MRLRCRNGYRQMDSPARCITSTQKLVTELNIVQEGVPAAIPAEACYLGWQESLTLLKQLVEAEIPDEM
jgi:hypothetical protein